MIFKPLYPVVLLSGLLASLSLAAPVPGAQNFELEKSKPSNSFKEPGTRFYGDIPSNSKTKGEEHIMKAMKDVNVTIAQKEKEPLVIEITVTNNGPDQIWFKEAISPFSTKAFELGLFKILADGVPNDFGYFDFNPNKEWPYDEKKNVNIKAGKSETRELTLPGSNIQGSSQWLDMLKGAGNVNMQMGGIFKGVSVKKNSWSHDDWEKSEMYPGYFSNVIELDF
ncbi:hypothetical protein FBEOM_2259 [Fusarium beomiforme]|uniref:Uncharacterized protein n=1 Tax=Fusarium beomiforme TaxID=44412 RepID=A0A9P5ASC5_9HYPO|nr:hypothetical protein FBEOM_2259 [Fusarium beomiforme]